MCQDSSGHRQDRGTELLAACAVRRLPRRSLCRVPRRAFPSHTGRARRQVLHPGCV